MNDWEIARGYRLVCEELLDYLFLCNKHNTAPLMHDIGLMMAGKLRLDKEASR